MDVRFADLLKPFTLVESACLVPFQMLKLHRVADIIGVEQAMTQNPRTKPAASSFRKNVELSKPRAILVDHRGGRLVDAS